MKQESWVIAFHAGTAYYFERSAKHEGSAFGGPIEAKVIGIKHGPRPLHLVARLGAHDLETMRVPPGIYEIPLVYGMRYDGCSMAYTVETSSRLRLLELKPRRSSEDWPYEHYPPLLPFAPIRIARKRRCTWRIFADMFFNMPPTQPCDLVVAVNAPASLGLALWGRWGDRSVTIVFECNYRQQSVRAYNITD